jgi:hypothetical protein
MKIFARSFLFFVTVFCLIATAVSLWTAFGIAQFGLDLSYEEAALTQQLTFVAGVTALVAGGPLIWLWTSRGKR